jgi:hypothetical protein
MVDTLELDVGTRDALSTPGGDYNHSLKNSNNQVGGDGPELISNRKLRLASRVGLSSKWCS